MAGIGFELKKLFKGKGLLSNIKAYFYSVLVSLGPFILATIMIVSIQLLLVLMDKPLKEKELFIATVIYSFIFAQIITSGFTMIITRFVSDMLYAKKLEYILPSLYGIITLVIPIAAVSAILFLWNSPVLLEIKFTSYLLFMEIIITYLIMVYLSALKDYMKIVKSFSWGVAVTLALSFVFLRFTSLDTVLGMTLAMNIGFLLILSLLLSYLKGFFKIQSARGSGKYFFFLTYFDRYYSLFFISLFYTLGLYIHNFIFWGSSIGVRVSSTYTYAPTYDVPSFYAFLSVMPSMVVFVVSLETSFYERYRAYYSLITGKGNFVDIENARKNMSRVLWSEIRSIMELQLFFSLIFVVAGSYFMPAIGMSSLSFDIFLLLVLGTYCNIILLVVVLVLLYFEDRRGAFFISATFLISNTLFTWGTIYLGEKGYGFGFFIAAFLSLVVALIELRAYINNIHYHTFCGQPVIQRQQTGLFGRLIGFLYRNQDQET
ncbi:MAG: exopolysaccharide Pel transporter PelG [Actinomycetia bacterium]|nr:exopolysaccharide Pel transporter PelG [Actinomycetes bacterium]